MLAGLVAAGFLAGCDGSDDRAGDGELTPTPTTPPASPSPPPRELRAALSRWADFPVAARPRPIVVLDEFPVPVDGFATNPAQLAFACRQIEAKIDKYPATPPHSLVTWAGGTTTAHDALPAEAAVGSMRTAGTPKGMGCADVEPVRLTRARLGQTKFGTDRGQVSTTAWIFTGPEVPGDGLDYPAVAHEEYLIPPRELAAGELPAVEVAAGGRSLTVFFYGTPTDAGACTSEYEAVVGESDTAVAIAIHAVPPAQPPPTDLACPEVSALRTLVVPLADILRARVVVDKDGALTPVCPIDGARTDAGPPFC